MLDLRSTGHSLCTRLRRKQSSFQVFPKWVNMSEICPRPHHQKRNNKCTVCWVVLLYATWNSQVGEPTRQFPKKARISGYSNSEMTINHAMPWFWCNQKFCEQFTTKHWPKHRQSSTRLQAYLHRALRWKRDGRGFHSTRMTRFRFWWAAQRNNLKVGGCECRFLNVLSRLIYHDLCIQAQNNPIHVFFGLMNDEWDVNTKQLT